MSRPSRRQPLVRRLGSLTAEPLGPCSRATDATTFVDNHGPRAPMRSRAARRASRSGHALAVERHRHHRRERNEGALGTATYPAPALQFRINNASRRSGPWKMLFDDVASIWVKGVLLRRIPDPQHLGDLRRRISCSASRTACPSAVLAVRDKDHIPNSRWAGWPPAFALGIVSFTDPAGWFVQVRRERRRSSSPLLGYAACVSVFPFLTTRASSPSRASSAVPCSTVNIIRSQRRTALLSPLERDEQGVRDEPLRHVAGDRLRRYSGPPPATQVGKVRKDAGARSWRPGPRRDRSRHRNSPASRARERAPRSGRRRGGDGGGRGSLPSP